MPDQQMPGCIHAKPLTDLLNEEASDQTGKAKFTFQLWYTDNHHSKSKETKLRNGEHTG